MGKEEELVPVHPKGEIQIAGNQQPESPASPDSFAGKVYVKWAPPEAAGKLGTAAVLHRSLRRALKAMDEATSGAWLKQQAEGQLWAAVTRAVRAPS
jgi:hypothetical protein